MKKSPRTDVDPEITAIAEVYSALKSLESDAQERVLAYVARKLSVKVPNSVATDEHRLDTDASRDASREDEQAAAQQDDVKEDDGISPIAKKWMKRNGLTAADLSSVFSLGVDEIDVVAKDVPGKKKTEKLRSVFLLKGVAAYLAGGAARFNHQQAKEACLHYDAFDAANFAVNFKRLASEVSGTKESGYSLTARGLAGATELVKAMVSEKKSG